MMKSNSVYRDAFKVSLVIFILGLIEFIIFAAFLSPRRDIIIGVLYGCAFTSLNFFYLAYSVNKSVNKDEKGSKAYMAASYNIRLLLTAAMIFIAARTELIHLWAAVIPLIFSRISVHIVSFVSSHKSKGSENS